MPKVAVVILNWNGKKFLEQFLPSVLQHSVGAEVIIADNASSDGSLSFLSETYPSVRVIKNQENGGFSKGYNDALDQIDADYYVLLNSDIEVTPAWIDPVIRLMESDPLIAACQPKLRSFYDKKKFEYAGGAGGFIDKFGYPFCRGRLFQNIEDDLGQYNDQVEVFWATGACMFVKAKLYKEFEGLDNDFFAHMEEIDFCWRLKNAGYKIMYCPDSTVFHVGGGTLPKKSAKKTFLNFRNNLILIYKNIPSKYLLKILFVRLILDFVASLKFLAEGNFADFLAVFKAYVRFYASLSRNKIKRKKIPHQEVAQVYRRSIIMDHYGRGKKKFSELDHSKF